MSVGQRWDEKDGGRGNESATMSWFLEKIVFSMLEKVLGRSGLLVALHREQVR